MPNFNRGHMTPSQIKHYYDVRKAREEQGLQVLTKPKNWRKKDGDDHPLIGMKLLDQETDEEYIVETVSNQWYDGFYTELIARKLGTQSHAGIMWEAISCRSPVMLRAIAEHRDRYEVLEKTTELA